MLGMVERPRAVAFPGGADGPSLWAPPQQRTAPASTVAGGPGDYGSRPVPLCGQPSQAALLTSMCFTLEAGSALRGMVIVRTPFLKWA